jgi:hypothetical protein
MHLHEKRRRGHQHHKTVIHQNPIIRWQVDSSNCFSYGDLFFLFVRLMSTKTKLNFRIVLQAFLSILFCNLKSWEKKCDLPDTSRSKIDLLSGRMENTLFYLRFGRKSQIVMQMMSNLFYCYSFWIQIVVINMIW